MDQFPTGILAILVIIFIAVGVIWLVQRFFGVDGSLPYRLVDSLLTPGERSFYGVLLPVADGMELQVFAKVRLTDLLWIPTGTDKRIVHRNRIQQKHVDFVLCDYQNVAPVLAIELDDSSHRRADRQVRDAFVDRACAAARLPLLRISTKRGYAPNQLAEQIQLKLGAASSSDPLAVADAPSPSIEPVADRRPSTASEATPPNDDRVTCPKCRAPLVERHSRRTGEIFLGCPNYPDCRHTQPLHDSASGKGSLA